MSEKLNPICYINGLIPMYFASQEFDIDHIHDNYAYILDATGLKILKRTPIGSFLLKAESFKELPKVNEHTKLNTPKIPISIINKTTAWFKKVYEKQNSEAVIFLFYNPKKLLWEVKPPKQEAVGMSVDYEKRPEMGEDWVIAGTIHSHCTSSAFHSGIDHTDEENFDGIHITIGKVTSNPPEVAYSMMVQGKRITLKAKDIIEDVEETFPKEWMDSITKKVYQHITYPYSGRSYFGSWNMSNQNNVNKNHNHVEEKPNNVIGFASEYDDLIDDISFDIEELEKESLIDDESDIYGSVIHEDDNFMVTHDKEGMPSYYPKK